MKSVKSLIKWILFVPVCLLSVSLMVISGLYPAAITDYFSTDMNGIAEVIAFSVLGLFLVCFVLSLFDRTTSPVHMLRKNFFCGGTALISAFALAATAALDVTSMIQTGGVEIMAVLTAVFTAISGVAMLFIGLNHFSGANSPKEISILYLALPLWCGVHLIDRFLKHTAMPVDAADTIDLIMFVAMALFFVYSMMIHAVIPGKNAVKSAITFGFPTAIVCLVYAVSFLFEVLNSDILNLIEVIPAVAYGMLGLYALGFTAELSFKSKTVEEQMILEPAADDSEEEYEDEYTEDTNTSEEYTETPVTAVSAEDVSGLLFDDADEVSEEDTYSEDDASVINDTEDYERPVAAVVRIVEDEDECDEAVTSDLPVIAEDIDSESDSESEYDIAEELYRAAQERDMQADAETDPAEPATTGSEEDMIIDGETEKISATGVSGGSESRPKGPTTREAIMYNDEDFILSIDGADAEAEDTFDEDEDISAFILERQEEDPVAPSHVVEKTYADRLDEIDQLIISIQGGDTSSNTDED